MNNLFICTEKGDNTANEILKDLMECIDCSMGGYWVKITRDEDNNDIRIFDLTSLCDEDTGNIFFRKNDATGISKLNLEIFNSKGRDILSKSFQKADVIIMKEIGFLESKAVEFTKKVEEILDSPKVVIGTIKELSCSYINSIKNRKDVITIKATVNNKNYVKDEVLKILTSWKIPFKD